MTEYYKEDFYDEYAIKKEDTIIAVVDSGTNARKICDELNTLYDENEQLKQQLADVDKAIDEKIEEYLNIPSLSDGALIVLKELKKELKR